MQYEEPDHGHEHEDDESLQDPANQIPMHARRLPRRTADQAARFAAPRSVGKKLSFPDHGAHAAPGGAEGGVLPRPVSSGEILEAKNQYLVAGQSGPAECDSAWSGEGTPLGPPG